MNMNEDNVKIIINEKDNTSPAGRSTDSTDIAFVPGFSSLATARVNQPILCTTVKEFEELFGTSPRILTGRDVAAYASLNMYAGEPDRGYVYAKELLYNGLSVVYSNITPAFESVLPVLAENIVCKIKDADGSYAANESKIGAGYAANTNNTVIKIEPVIDINETVRVEGTFSITVSGKTRKTIEFFPVTKNCSLVSAKVTYTKSDVKCDVVKYSDTMVDFVNNTASNNTFDVVVDVDVEVNLKSGDIATLKLTTLEDSILDAFYTEEPTIVDQLDMIADKSVYSVKYITSGGYPSIVKGAVASSASAKFAGDMLNAAATRGDAIALIDYQLEEDTKLFGLGATDTSVYQKLSTACESLGNGSFGAAMYPWAHYNCANSGFEDLTMPASFAYLTCLAKAIKTSPNWLAMAGVSRGVVRGIKKLCTPNNVLSNTDAEQMQPKFGTSGNTISINCITDVKPYGLTLWGNRTLLPVDSNGTRALNFLNTRNMISDIKKLLYTTGKSLMFEQNSDMLWLKFKNSVSPLLNQLKSGNGISDYKIIKGTTKYNGDPLTKGEISAVIKIYPLYAVEYFELTVEISDQDVTVS